jgi:transcriptional regulator with XRE-family HTH domain
LTNAVEQDHMTQLLAARELSQSGRARELRQRAGLSLYEMAAAVGVAAATIHRWEHGQRRPHGEAALRYGAVLDLLARREVSSRVGSSAVISQHP